MHGKSGKIEFSNQDEWSLHVNRLKPDGVAAHLIIDIIMFEALSSQAQDNSIEHVLIDSSDSSSHC